MYQLHLVIITALNRWNASEFYKKKMFFGLKSFELSKITERISIYI